MPKKRTSLDGLFASQPETIETPITPPQPPPKNGMKVHTSVYLPDAVYEQLRALAFEERRKMHDYFLEGLDMVFKAKGLRSIAELTQKKDG